LRTPATLAALLVLAPALLAPPHAWHGRLVACHADADIALAACRPAPDCGGCARPAPPTEPPSPAPAHTRDGSACGLCILALTYAPLLDAPLSLPEAPAVGATAPPLDTVFVTRAATPIAARGPPSL
jgi:hypothetical protein